MFYYVISEFYVLTVTEILQRVVLYTLFLHYKDINCNFMYSVRNRFSDKLQYLNTENAIYITVYVGFIFHKY